jgi:PAS domain S-box-containing protein
MQQCWRRVINCWKKLPIERRGSLAVAIPLVCLMGSVVAYTLLRQRMIEAQIYVDQTNEVLAHSQKTTIGLLNAETGVRGYYISKERLFLQPYDLAVNQLPTTLTNLERLVRDNPVQKQRVKLLIDIVVKRMQMLQKSVQRVEVGDIATPEVVSQRLVEGKREMDRFREKIQEFEAEERRLLAIRTQMLEEQQNLNAWAMWYGIPLGLFGTAVAVRLLRQLSTELRERELRLRESRNLIEAIVANVVDGVTIVNAHGKIESFNDAAVKMFGYSPSEIIGWDWQKLLNQEPEDDEIQQLMIANPSKLVKVMPNGKIWQAMGQRKNGELFPVEISMNNIALDDDRIAIIRDITDRQQAAAKLQAKANELTTLNASLQVTNESLLQINEELDQFAYITSHDLKAPLRAIASLSEWIEEDLDEHISRETRSQLHLLRRRVYRMQALLNSLLEYSRAGRTRSPIAAVDVGKLLAKIIQALAPPKTFTVEIVTPMPILDTRWQALEQVFSHLIDNAIRHHPTEMGIVKISAADLGDRYEFAIVDNGEGIEPQYQKRIYTIFQTLKARDLQENIGAGLAIVKKIVTAEGGTIQLESVAGQGAIFRFTWLKQPITKDTTPSYEVQ